MQQLTGHSRSNRSFEVGDYVFLELQLYKQHIMAKRINHKFVSQVFWAISGTGQSRSNRISASITPETTIHNIFLVSQLKKCIDPTISRYTLIPISYPRLGAIKISEAIIYRKMVKRANKSTTQVLVKICLYQLRLGNTVTLLLSSQSLILEDKDYIWGLLTQCHGYTHYITVLVVILRYCDCI